MNTIHKILMVVLFCVVAVSATADEIHDAALQGDIARVKTLVAEDSTLVNARDEQENVVLHYAIFGKQKEIVEFLISKKADVHSVNMYNQNALLYAAYVGAPEIAELLLSKGAKVSEKDFLGRRPLHYAARQHKNVIELLLAHGADPNTTDNDGLTPLHTAVGWGRTEIAMLLIASGADVNTLTGDGKTILHLASIKGYTALVELLVARGMNTNATDNDGNTPLFYATMHGNKKVADLLKRHGATAEGLEKIVGSSLLLKEEFNDGEAAIWYLGHSAYAVKTKNHFLIFDYVEYTPLPDEPCLANGHIDPDEISDQNVYVFVTHVHSDHYDSTIFDWTKSVKNITYIFGWQAFEDPEYVYMGPRTAKRVDDLEIESIHSPEADEIESNFLVEVDGVVMYHGGGYSHDSSIIDIYKKDVEYLATTTGRIDIVFTKVGSTWINEEAFFMLETVLPNVMFPSHARERESTYEDFAQEASERNSKTTIVWGENRGDRFIYTEGSIKK